MADIADYKIKIFVDALVSHFDQEPNFDIADDDMTLWPDYALDAELAETDIAHDLTALYRNRSAGWRAASRKKYAQSERGKNTNAAAKKAWNEFDAGKLRRKLGGDPMRAK